MPVNFVSGLNSDHPITRLDYDLSTGPVDIGARRLTLTTLSHVEREIDRVFHWLEAVGRPADEIESLAPYFGVVWPAALALAGFIDQPVWRDRLRGKNVLEIGCGLALPAMVAALNGARMTCSDSHPDVPRFLERNVALNEPLSLAYLDGDTLAQEPVQYDVVIASDVLYEARLVPVFAETMSRLASRTGVCVIADPGRPYIQTFANAMIAKGWSYELQPWSVRHNAADSDIFVMIFKRP